MREGLVGLGHLVGILALLDRGAEVVGGVHDLAGQPLLHGLLAAGAGVVGQPAQTQGLAPLGPHLEMCIRDSYETISEKLHAQLGWKVGVISSVNLNHATPAAFYAHQAKRSNYYEIGQELVASNFEYFAGGGLLKPTGPDKDKTSLYDLAADAGYKVVMTQAEAEAVTSADGKVLIIDEHLADSDAFAYENDRADGNWALSD